MRTDPQPKPRPGDEAPAHGTGKIDGKPCENCDGTGRIIRGIGGA